jgi:hypothetical protein
MSAFEVVGAIIASSFVSSNPFGPLGFLGFAFWYTYFEASGLSLMSGDEALDYVQDTMLDIMCSELACVSRVFLKVCFFIFF